MPAAPEKSTPRQRLLDAACRLFYEHGITATGIDKVLAEAGVAKMTLYNAFGSKDGLVLEYLRHRYGGFVPALRSTLEARQTGAAHRILGVFEVLEEWFQDPGFRGCPLLNTAIEVSDANHPARESAASLVNEFRGYLEELCREAGAQEAEVLAEQLCVLAYGAIAWSQVTRNPSSARNSGAIAQTLLRECGILPSDRTEEPNS